METIYDNEDPQFSGEIKNIEELYSIDEGIRKKSFMSEGGNSEIFIYTSSHNNTEYIFRKSRDVETCEEEFNIHKTLAQDNIAPKIYYGAKFINGPEKNYISIIEKGENLLVLLNSLHTKNNIKNLFTQCLILIYRMIYKHNIYCADQKIPNFIYFFNEGKIDVRMIDFGMDWCKLENFIKDKKYITEFLSTEKKREKFKFKFLILLWIQTIIFYYLYSYNSSKSYIKKIVKEIINKTIEDIKNIEDSPFEKYNKDPYQEIVCNKDLLNFLKKSKPVIRTFEFYVPITETERFDETYLDCNEFIDSLINTSNENDVSGVNSISNKVSGLTIKNTPKRNTPKINTPNTLNNNDILPKRIKRSPKNISTKIRQSPKLTNSQLSNTPLQPLSNLSQRKTSILPVSSIKLGGLINKKQNKKSKSKKQKKKSNKKNKSNK